MRVKEIIDLAKRIVQDSSFDDLWLGYINACCGELASVYSFPCLHINSTITVPASSSSVAVPSDFLHSITHAVNVTRESKINVFDDFDKFLSKFPLLNKNDDVKDLSWYGANVFVQGVPSSDQVIRLFYYSIPKTLGEASEPSFIPMHLQRDLLLNRCLSEAYNIIEDGVDGTKVNANKYESRFQLACIKLEGFIGVPLAKPQFVAVDESESDIPRDDLDDL